MGPHLRLHGDLPDRLEQFAGLLHHDAVVVGADEQIHTGVTALFLEQFAEVGFPVADVDQPGLRHLRGTAGAGSSNQPWASSSRNAFRQPPIGLFPAGS